MTRKTIADIEGLEYDWLAADADGHLALLSTAGAGFTPEPFLEDTDAHDASIEALLGLPASTEALSLPPVASDCINTWKLAAERGLFAFDADPNDGSYRLVATPKCPILMDSLPPAIQAVVASITFKRLRFGESNVLTSTALAREPL